MYPEDHMSPEISPSVVVRSMSTSGGRNEMAQLSLRTDYLTLRRCPALKAPPDRTEYDSSKQRVPRNRFKICFYFCVSVFLDLFVFCFFVMRICLFAFLSCLLVFLLCLFFLILSKLKNTLVAYEIEKLKKKLESPPCKLRVIFDTWCVCCLMLFFCNPVFCCSVFCCCFVFVCRSERSCV